MKHLLSFSRIFLACLLLSGFGCRHHSISLSISESDTRYKIVASFDERNTTKVDRCLNRYLTGRNNMSFINSRIDGELTLDDRTTFYIKKHPGVLVIDFNKDHNPAHSYDEIKALAKGLGEELK